MARRRGKTGAKVSVNGGKYNIIPAGTYYGVVKSVKLEGYDVKKSKARMEKLTPTVELFTPDGTTIDQQGFTIGAINKKGMYYRVDKDKNKSPIFGGYDLKKDMYGARMMMVALGMVNSEGEVDFDEKALREMVVRVTVAHSSYEKDGVTREKNVITHWNVVNLDEVPESIDTSLWVQEELVVGEDSDGTEEVQLLTFTSELARERFLEIWEEGEEGEEDDIDEEDDEDLEEYDDDEEDYEEEDESDDIPM